MSFITTCTPETPSERSSSENPASTKEQSASPLLVNNVTLAKDSNEDNRSASKTFENGAESAKSQDKQADSPSLVSNMSYGSNSLGDIKTVLDTVIKSLPSDILKDILVKLNLIKEGAPKNAAETASTSTPSAVATDNNAQKDNVGPVDVPSEPQAPTPDLILAPTPAPTTAPDQPIIQAGGGEEGVDPVTSNEAPVNNETGDSQKTTTDVEAPPGGDPHTPSSESSEGPVPIGDPPTPLLGDNAPPNGEVQVLKEGESDEENTKKEEDQNAEQQQLQEGISKLLSKPADELLKIFAIQIKLDEQSAHITSSIASLSISLQEVIAYLKENCDGIHTILKGIVQLDDNHYKKIVASLLDKLSSVNLHTLFAPHPADNLLAWRIHPESLSSMLSVRNAISIIKDVGIMTMIKNAGKIDEIKTKLDTELRNILNACIACGISFVVSKIQSIVPSKSNTAANDVKEAQSQAEPDILKGDNDENSIVEAQGTQSLTILGVKVAERPVSVPVSVNDEVNTQQGASHNTSQKRFTTIRGRRRLIRTHPVTGLRYVQCMGHMMFLDYPEMESWLTLVYKLVQLTTIASRWALKFSNAQRDIIIAKSSSVVYRIKIFDKKQQRIEHHIVTRDERIRDDVYAQGTEFFEVLTQILKTADFKHTLFDISKMSLSKIKKVRTIVHQYPIR